MNITPDSSLFYAISRKSRCTIQGDLAIRNPVPNDENLNEQSFYDDTGALLKFVNLGKMEIVVGIEVKYVFILESEATFSRIDKDLYDQFPKCESITCIPSGTPDMFSRLLFCKFSKGNPRLLFVLIGDGDRGGFDIIHLWKCGSPVRYTYMNNLLTIPTINFIRVRGFQLMIEIFFYHLVIGLDWKLL